MSDHQDLGDEADGAVTPEVTTKIVEKSIEVASALKQGIEGLYEAYGCFPAIIEREHRAIKASDYPGVQATCEEKEVASARVEACFEAMMKAGDYLGQIRAELTGKPRVHPVSLTECVEALKTVAAVIGEASTGGKVLHHVLRGLEGLHLAFNDRYREVKPKIEANRYLINTMLQNMQASYVFWLAEVEKAAISYNASGVQKAAGRNSGFKARA